MIPTLKKFGRGPQPEAEIHVDKKHREQREAQRAHHLKRSGGEPDGVGQSRLTDKLLAGNIRRKQRGPDQRPRRLAIGEKQRVGALHLATPKPRAEREREQKTGGNNADIQSTDSKGVQWGNLASTNREIMRTAPDESHSTVPEHGCDPRFTETLYQPPRPRQAKGAARDSPVVRRDFGRPRFVEMFKNRPRCRLGCMRPVMTLPT